MVQHALECSKVEALEQILGRSRPDRSRDESAEERTERLNAEAQRREEAKRREEKRQREVEAEAQLNRDRAREIVRDISPIQVSAGEKYLRKIRAIDTDAIYDLLIRTDAIGWNPRVYFHEPGHALHGQHLRAIIGVMTDPVTAQRTGAISRTYLDPNLAKVGKAKTLGTPAGIIRLSRDDEVTHGLHIAEGIETALDAMARNWRPTWACGSKSTMADFPVLPGIECLTIFADNDANGGGLRAAIEAAERWLAAGREVHVYQRETTGDLNDAYREVSG